MPENILPKTPSKSAAPKHHGGGLVVAIILTIILTIVLVFLGERIIFDLNRAANPVIDKNVSSQQRGSNYAYSVPSGYSQERFMGASSTKVIYKTTEKSSYKLYKILIHAAFILPIFLLTFLFYYLLYLRHTESPYRVLVIGYLVFAFWMILHLIIETGAFVLSEYKNAGIYIILVALATMFTGLVIFIQKKRHS